MEKINYMFQHHCFLMRVSICSFGLLLLLFAKQSLAGIEKMDQVLFSGIEASDGQQISITYRPDMGVNIISTAETAHSIPNENIRELSRQNESSYNAYNNVNLFEIAQYSAGLAHDSLHGRPSANTNIVQFSPDDPVFGRIAGVQFRFKKLKKYCNNSNILNLHFEQISEGMGSHRLSFRINLRRGIVPNSDNYVSFNYHFVGVSFWRQDSLASDPVRYDGFRAEELINLLRQENENDSDPSGGSSSRHDSEPANQNDPSTSPHDQSGRKKRSFYFSGGAGDGGCACSVVPLIRNAAVLMVPLCIQAYVQSGMHSGYTNK